MKSTHRSSAMVVATLLLASLIASANAEYSPVMNTPADRAKISHSNNEICRPYRGRGFVDSYRSRLMGMRSSLEAGYVVADDLIDNAREQLINFGNCNPSSQLVILMLNDWTAVSLKNDELLRDNVFQQLAIDGQKYVGTSRIQ